MNGDDGCNQIENNGGCGYMGYRQYGNGHELGGYGQNGYDNVNKEQGQNGYNNINHNKEGNIELNLFGDVLDELYDENQQ